MSYTYISPEDMAGFLKGSKEHFEAQNDTNCKAYRIVTRALKDGYISLPDLAEIAAYNLKRPAPKDYKENMYYGYLVKKEES